MHNISNRSSVNFSILCRKIVFPSVIVISCIVVTDPVFLIFIILGTLFLCIPALKFDIRSLGLVFSLPWLIILFFSLLPISDFHRLVSVDVVRLISLLLCVSLFILPGDIKSKPTIHESLLVRKSLFLAFLIFYCAFSFLNVILAGYVPLVNLITSGDSAYMNFGVKGIYGLFNAFSNAFGLTAFYLWMKTKERIYGFVYFLVLSVFILFVTRQNVISLIVESFALYIIFVKKVPFSKLFVGALLLLFLFGLFGDIRLGDSIAQKAGVIDIYQWLPSAFVWFYSYFYFNLLNLDNALQVYTNPMFDMSSVLGLLPSFFRPAIEDGVDVLEVANFTVGSFILPIYRDLGFLGVILTFSIFCVWGRIASDRVKASSDYVAVCDYAVLYFCFSFSFFENFWFYLPVIFQILFFRLFRYIGLVREA